jgi:hypothetical protein
MAQLMRQSQFVLTWGPGAILEGVNGPRMIPMPDIGLFRGISPEQFEISDERMSRGLLGGGRIFRLPSNAELGKDNTAYIYLTKVFPEWWLCSTHWNLYRFKDDCPECRTRNKIGKRDAIRFVMACPEGHLDDVNWDYVVHLQNRGICPSGSQIKFYRWKSGGGSLRDIEIECPRCGMQVNFGEVYQKNWLCTGRFPEREPIGSPPDRKGCSSSAVIIQRQASNLRIPDIVSLFTINRYTQLHLLLDIPAVKAVLISATPTDKTQLENILKKLNEVGLVQLGTVSEILRHSWDEINRAIDDIRASSKSTGYGNLIQEEFRALVDASINGVPPMRTPPPVSRIRFEVPKTRIRKVSGIGGHLFRIVPITRLRTIIVQKGYRRVHPDGKSVPVSFDGRTGEKWYPGVEHLGEGIFIMFDSNDGYIDEKKFGGAVWNAWKNSYYIPPESYKSTLFRDQNKRDELHPFFVWWHTLSHLLIRVLAIDSGYSAASIRERIYFESNERGVRGGIVLYTTQPGEGTMGGLVTLIAQFEKILKRAVEISELCPNDPLCLEQTFISGNINGAACYGCLFVSETSCEHRNIWLDRHLIQEVVP